MEEIATNKLLLTEDEQFTLILVKSFEDIGVCPSFTASWQAHYKEAANSLVEKGLLLRCYDIEEKRRLANNEDKNYALKDEEARSLAESLNNLLEEKYNLDHGSLIDKIIGHAGFRRAATMNITCLNDLRRFGIDCLTGESCGLGLRLLCDVNAQGKKILEKCFGIVNLNLPESWNSGSKDDPHVGSIMLSRDMLNTVGIFALLESGCKKVLLYENDTLQGLMSDEEEYSRTGLIRVFEYRGTAVDPSRNTHEMSGRVI